MRILSKKKPGHAIKSTPLGMNPSIFFSYTVGKGRQGTSSTLPSIFDLSTRCLDSFVASIFVLFELVGLDKYQYRRPRYKKSPDAEMRWLFWRGPAARANMFPE